MPPADLNQQIFRTLDGSCDQLREKGYEQRIFKGVLLYIDLAPIYIHGIGERLKGVKGDTHRQDHIKRWIQKLHAETA